MTQLLTSKFPSVFIELYSEWVLLRLLVSYRYMGLYRSGVFHLSVRQTNLVTRQNTVN